MSGRGWKLGAALVSAGVAVACSGSTTGTLKGAPPGSATFMGTYNNETIRPVDAYASQSSNTPTPSLTIVMSTAPMACLDAQERIAQPQSSLLTFSILISNIPSRCPVPAITPGTYYLTPPGGLAIAICGATQTVTVTHTTLDSTCNGGDPWIAVIGGYIEIQSVVAGGTVEGRFDLTTAGGEELTGQFSAPLCDLALVQPGIAMCGETKA